MMDHGGLIWAPARILCGILSFFYRLVSGIRVLFYHVNILPVRRLSCPVISIGNITSGGTGKTPAVIFLARALSEAGKNVSVLTRGYKGGDEARLLEQKLPMVEVLVGKNRFRSGRRASGEVCIMDDGFQHISLHRDLNILLIDATNPFDNRKLLPRGFLREPLTSIKRADLLLLTKVNLADQQRLQEIKREIQELNIPVVETIHKPAEVILAGEKKESFSPNILYGKQVTAFSSIGSPDSFSRTLKGLGARVEQHFVYPDHYRYKRKDVEYIKRKAGRTLMVTTEKDGMRLPADFSGYYMLRVELTIISNRESWEHAIQKVISR